MHLKVDGWDLNLRFSAAHFLPTHDKCQRLHGHDYSVSVQIEGFESKGFVVDFLLVEKELREMLDRLDHRVLLPKQSEKLEWHASDNKTNTEISYNGYLVSIPSVFICNLPVDSTSSEELSDYLAGELMEKLKEEENVKSLQLCLYEGPGRGACATREK